MHITVNCALVCIDFVMKLVITGTTEAWVAATDLPAEHVMIRANTPVNITGSSSALDPEKIISVYLRNGVPYMAVKWKGIPTADYLDVKEIRAKWPHVLITFYENNLVLSQKDDGRLVNESELDYFVETGQKVFPQQYSTPKEILAAVMSKGELFQTEGNCGDRARNQEDGCREICQ